MKHADSPLFNKLRLSFLNLAALHVADDCRSRTDRGHNLGPRIARGRAGWCLAARSFRLGGLRDGDSVGGVFDGQ